MTLIEGVRKKNRKQERTVETKDVEIDKRKWMRKEENWEGRRDKSEIMNLP